MWRCPPTRERLEHVCRYLLRPPLALERLTESSQGQLMYALAHPRADGVTHLLLDPLELLGAGLPVCGAAGTKGGTKMDRLAIGRVLLAVVASVLMASCVGPLVEVVRVDEATAQKLGIQVQVYESDDLKGRRFKVLQPIEATSCKNKLWDPEPSREDATNQLRFKAAQLGANGLLNVSCGGERGTSLGKNCWKTITCNAGAVEVLR